MIAGKCVMQLYIANGVHFQRVPFSSLLYAVPEYQWRKRTDSYERKVEQYTWLMEEELYMIQIKAMMKVAFKIIMTTKLLSDKGRAQVNYPVPTVLNSCVLAIERFATQCARGETITFRELEKRIGTNYEQ